MKKVKCKSMEVRYEGNGADQKKSDRHGVAHRGVVEGVVRRAAKHCIH